MINFVYIAVSLDGYIADSKGGIDWLPEVSNNSESDYAFDKFLRKVDGIIMGRNTFEKVLSFGVWPYSKKVFVLSNSLKSIPLELVDKAEIVKGDLKAILSQLNSKGYENFYVDGGKTIQSFLNKGLIQEMIITTIPILLGGGIPLFGHLNSPQHFHLVNTEIMQDSLLTCHYKLNLD